MVCALFAAPLSAGGPYWARTYGTGYTQFLRDMTVLPNGSVIAVGSTYVKGSFYEDAFAMELSPDGNVTWARTYGGKWDDFGHAVATTRDGRILIAGTAQSFGSTGAWLMSIAPNGTLLWGKLYRGKYLTGFTSLTTARNGDIVAGGWIDLTPNASDTDEFFVVRTDSTGRVKWANTYGGHFTGDVRAVAMTKDGDIFVVGSHIWGREDIIVLKLRPNGSVIWAKLYRDKMSSEVSSIAITPNGGLVIAGTVMEPLRTFVLRIDPNGKLLWARHYSPENGGQINAVAVAPGGDILLAGNASVQGEITDLWALLITPTGSLKWSEACGGKFGEWATAATAPDEGEFWVGGLTLSFGRGYGDIWLLHVPSSGKWECKLCKNLNVTVSPADFSVVPVDVKTSPLDTPTESVHISEKEWNLTTKTQCFSRPSHSICGPAILLLLTLLPMMARRRK